MDSHREAEVGSDHHVMVPKFKVKLKKNVKQVPYTNPPFNMDELLHITVKRNFVIKISNRFKSISMPENPTPEEL